MTHELARLYLGDHSVNNSNVMTHRVRSLPTEKEAYLTRSEDAEREV